MRTTLRRCLHHLIEPQVLFPAFAVLVLAVIWIGTLLLVRVEHAGADRAARAKSRELVETYEAQTVRALHEIDQTLKVVKQVYEITRSKDVLRDLAARDLLPSNLVFSVSLADARGDVFASTRPGTGRNVSDREYFRLTRGSDALAIGLPRRDPVSGEWRLRFARRLDAADGSFAGAVLVGVECAYFVSGYERAQLGENGVIALLGSDGVFRARRSGDALRAGDAIDFAAVVPRSAEAETQTALVTSAWDGVRRYSGVRQLSEFPLAVIVGVSEEEELAKARPRTRAYAEWAVAGSMLVLLVVATMGRLSWRLAQSRRLAAQDQRLHAERVEHLAYHDTLTALPNRSLFNKLLAQAVSQAHRYGTRFAVLFIDLDRFKQINDTLGHDAGDQLLVEVAGRLRGCLRESDTVARLGGDEFVALLPELVEDAFAATVAQKILAALAKPFTLRGHDLRVTASIGIATYPEDGKDANALMKCADSAMYQAKEQGKNNFQFHAAGRESQSLEQLSLEGALRGALERDQFVLHYQPELELDGGRIAGTEVLLRWVHPDLGIVAPKRFLAIAEDTGLIVPIGRWVLRTACRQAVQWQRQGLPPLRIAVNLSARQFFDAHLAGDVRAILADTGLEANLLELEVDEDVLTRNVPRVAQILEALAAVGVRIAIDHFGAGHASLSALRAFPLHAVKIDRSVVLSITEAAPDTGIADTVIGLGKQLGLSVIAQGIESKAQAEFLRRRACDEFQGFYFNRPVPADEFAALLRASAVSSGPVSALQSP
jgi:diguanylate cyclase (GGDEF)-like protein